MKFVLFGPAASSRPRRSRYWQSLSAALLAQHHRVLRFEQFVKAPHASTLDATQIGVERYTHFDQIRTRARRALRDADVALISSDCPDALLASELVLQSAAGVKAFYDLDTPLSIARLSHGRAVDYIPASGLGDFDVVLSCAGGPALEELRDLVGAPRVAALYFGVDPAQHAASAAEPNAYADLLFMGDYYCERHASLSELFVRTAQRLPNAKFTLAGQHYPSELTDLRNLRYLCATPADAAALRCAARLNLSIARPPAAAIGQCAPASLFEAAACGVAVISNAFRGLEQFYVPGEEILVAHDSNEVIAALEYSDRELNNLAQRARERTLAEHSISRRAQQLVEIVSAAREPQADELLAAG